MPSKTRKEAKPTFDLSKVHKTKVYPKHEQATYNMYRKEFDIEWEGGVEKELQDLHFTDDEREHGTDIENRQISLDALRAYQWVQNERTRRREIIEKADLFDYHTYEEYDAKTLEHLKSTGVDMRIYQQFMSRDEYVGFIKALDVERMLLQKISVLKKLRSSGKRTLPEDYQPLDLTRGKKAKLGHEQNTSDYSLLSQNELDFCRKVGVTAAQYLTYKELLTRESVLYGGVSDQRAAKLLQKTPSEARHFLTHFERLGLIIRRKTLLPDTPPAATAAAMLPATVSPMIGSSRIHKEQKKHHKHKPKKHHHHEHKHDKE